MTSVTLSDPCRAREAPAPIDTKTHFQGKLVKTWAVLELNQRLPPCQGGTLPLS